MTWSKAYVFVPAMTIFLSSCSTGASPAQIESSRLIGDSPSPVKKAPSSNAPTMGEDNAPPSGMKPLLSNILRARRLYILDSAVTVLQSKCESAKGVTKPIPAAATLNAYLSREKLADSRLYGISDIEAARKWGFSLPQDEASKIPRATFSPLPLATNGGDAVADTPSAAASIPESSKPSLCIQEANRTLYGFPEGSGSTLGFELFTQAWSEAQTSSAVKMASSKWHKCMSAQGYSVSDDTLTPPDGVNVGDNSSSEKKAAVSSVICRQNAGLVAAWDAETAKRAQRLASMHREELEAESSRLDKLIDKAQRIIDFPGR